MKGRTRDGRIGPRDGKERPTNAEGRSTREGALSLVVHKGGRGLV